jgi:hypothetical protein
MRTSYLSIFTVISLGSLFITGCMHQSEDPPMTQLQIREIQTRTFEEKDAKSVMKAMMEVLQDDGYIMKNANLDLGMLSAEKDIFLEKNSEIFIARFVQGDRARWTKHAVIEASSTISEWGTSTKIRVNFQRKVIDNFGSVVTVEQVLDGAFYEDFFQKVHKGLYIQKEQI